MVVTKHFKPIDLPHSVDPFSDNFAIAVKLGKEINASNYDVNFWYGKAIPGQGNIVWQKLEKELWTPENFKFSNWTEAERHNIGEYYCLKESSLRLATRSAQTDWNTIRQYLEIYVDLCTAEDLNCNTTVPVTDTFRILTADSYYDSEDHENPVKQYINDNLFYYFHTNELTSVETSLVPTILRTIDGKEKIFYNTKATQADEVVLSTLTLLQLRFFIDDIYNVYTQKEVLRPNESGAGGLNTQSGLHKFLYILAQLGGLYVVLRGVLGIFLEFIVNRVFWYEAVTILYKLHKSFKQKLIDKASVWKISYDSKVKTKPKQLDWAAVSTDVKDRSSKIYNLSSFKSSNLHNSSIVAPSSMSSKDLKDEIRKFNSERDVFRIIYALRELKTQVNAIKESIPYSNMNGDNGKRNTMENLRESPKNDLEESKGNLLNENEPRRPLPKRGQAPQTFSNQIALSSHRDEVRTINRIVQNQSYSMNEEAVLIPGFSLVRDRSVSSNSYNNYRI